MASQKPWRDWIYCAIISVQLIGMLVLDLSAFYPAFVMESPSSPLHFLATVRDAYLVSSGDPFFAEETHAPWFQIFLYIEGLVQFPLAAYLSYKLMSSKPTSGPAELAGLVFGCVTAMGAAACCFEVWHMGPDVLSADKKATILYGTYLPFSIIPTLMAVDMYMRLLTRVEGSDKSKTQ